MLELTKSRLLRTVLHSTANEQRSNNLECRTRYGHCIVAPLRPDTLPRWSLAALLEQLNGKDAPLLHTKGECSLVTNCDTF